MSPLVDLLGVVFGVSGVVLAVAMLLHEHRDAPMMHRLTVGGIGLLCFLLAVNSSVAFRSIYFDLSPSPIAVGFALLASLNWLYRLIRRRR